MIKTLFQCESETEKGKFLKLDEGTEGDFETGDLFIVITKKDMDDRIMCLTISQATEL